MGGGVEGGPFAIESAIAQSHIAGVRLIPLELAVHRLAMKLGRWPSEIWDHDAHEVMQVLTIEGLEGEWAENAAKRNG